MINLDRVPKDLMRNNTKDLVRACYLLFIPQITKRLRIERKMYVSSFKSIVFLLRIVVILQPFHKDFYFENSC